MQANQPWQASPQQYKLTNLPPEISVFDTPVEALGVGDPNKVGILDVTLCPIARKTRVIHQYQQGPLFIYTPIYTDPQRPDMAFLYTIQLGDGLVQGDRYFLNVKCAADSAVHITTQAATKLYRMEENFASQIVHIEAGPGACVEYLPDPVIPFRDARFYQHLHLTLDPSADVILGEMLLPGRVAHGEAHSYTLYYTDTEVTAPDGSLLCADRILLQPARTPIHARGILGPYEVLASLSLFTHRVSARDLSIQLCNVHLPQQALIAGVSELPNGCGVGVRMLARTSLDAREAFRLLWNEARLAILGVPVPDLRKG